MEMSGSQQLTCSWIIQCFMYAIVAIKRSQKGCMQQDKDRQTQASVE